MHWPQKKNSFKFAYIYIYDIFGTVFAVCDIEVSMFKHQCEVSMILIGLTIQQFSNLDISLFPSLVENLPNTVCTPYSCVLIGRCHEPSESDTTLQ